MRSAARQLATLIASIAIAACSSGTVIVVRRPASPPPPPPPRVEPLEITVARPVRGHLLVQTNRPSYVALFEIVPDRGVALLAPAHAHERTWMLAGLNWVPVSWRVQSTMYYGPPRGTAIPARWVYAIASDEPLRLPDEAFHPSYIRRVLGPAAYRGTNPYVTMRAIARAFVPSVVDEAWAEDAYALAATYASDPYRVVRIYCANRTVYEVPEEMADRAWCPVRGAPGGTVVRSRPTRPDSVVTSNGQRVRWRVPEATPVRGPIDRVSEPTRPEHAPVGGDDSGPKNARNTDVREAKDAKDAAKERRGNGNAYGHTDDPNVKGRGIENEKREEKREDPRREPRVDPPVTVKPETQAEKVEVKEEKKEEKELRREEKQEKKAEPVEQKAEHKPEQKPEQKQEERSAKPEEKPESKPEAKAETKEEKAEAKSEEKPTGKPDEKAHGKPDADPPGKKDGKGKP
jgi:hypothetical protein